MQVRVIDAAGRELASGRDLAALRAQLGEAAQLSFAEAGPALERRGLKAWTFGDLPETLSIVKHGQRLTGYPALIDDADSVSIALLDTRDAADAAMRAGVVRLLRIALKQSVATFEKGGAGFAQAAMQLKTTIPTDRLLADVLAADLRPGVRRRRSAAAVRKGVRRTDAARTRTPARRRRRRVPSPGRDRRGASRARTADQLGMPGVHSRAVAEVRRRRDALVYPGFFRATPWAQLAHLPRYLTALEHRLAKLPENPERDARHSAVVERGGNAIASGGTRLVQNSAHRSAQRTRRRSTIFAGRSRSSPFRCSPRSSRRRSPCPANGWKRSGRNFVADNRCATRIVASIAFVLE